MSLPASFTEPMPDYDSPENTLLKNHMDRPKGTLGRIAMQEAIKANGENAEMESIESFQLNNPSSKIPAPPPMYFSSQKNGTTTMKKIQRPVSVIINSYDDKKDPGKFDFLETNGQGNAQQRNNEDMSTRLKNELEKTLSRSNLRRRSDSMVSFSCFSFELSRNSTNYFRIISWRVMKTATYSTSKIISRETRLPNYQNHPKTV